MISPGLCFVSAQHDFPGCPETPEILAKGQSRQTAPAYRSHAEQSDNQTIPKQEGRFRADALSSIRMALRLGHELHAERKQFAAGPDPAPLGAWLGPSANPLGDCV